MHKGIRSSRSSLTMLQVQGTPWLCEPHLNPPTPSKLEYLQWLLQIGSYGNFTDKKNQRWRTINQCMAAQQCESRSIQLQHTSFLDLSCDRLHPYGGWQRTVHLPPSLISSGTIALILPATCLFLKGKAALPLWRWITEFKTWLQRQARDHREWAASLAFHMGDIGISFP